MVREGWTWANERPVLGLVTNQRPGEASLPGCDNVIKFTSRVCHSPGNVTLVLKQTLETNFSEKFSEKHYNLIMQDNKAVKDK